MKTLFCTTLVAAVAAITAPGAAQSVQIDSIDARAAQARVVGQPQPIAGSVHVDPAGGQGGAAGGCGAAGAGDCCAANGSPFCDDADCCNAVCACDPFCCDVDWDGFCAGDGFDPDCLCGDGECGVNNTAECDFCEADGPAEALYQALLDGGQCPCPALPNDPEGVGDLVADDLQMISGGSITSIGFSLVNFSPSQLVDVTLELHFWEIQLDDEGFILAPVDGEQFAIIEVDAPAINLDSGFGFGLLTVDVTGLGLEFPSLTWAGLRFPAANFAGPGTLADLGQFLSNQPVIVGASADVMWGNTLGLFAFEGGDPVANAVWQILGEESDTDGACCFDDVPPCPEDLTNDGNVGVDDLLELLAAWGTPDADLTGDGNTGVDDLLALLAAWGPCPEGGAAGIECVELPEGQCLAEGGDYRGDFSSCATPLVCTEVLGACCLPDFTCDDLPEGTCLAQGGEFLGDFTNCVADACPDGETCATALDVEVNGDPVTTSTVGNPNPEVSCGASGTSSSGVAWFTVEGDGTTLTAATCGSDLVDTRMAVFCNNCADAVCVTGTQGGCPGAFQAQATWCSDPDATYFVAVWGQGATEDDVTLSVTSDDAMCPSPVDCFPGAAGSSSAVQFRDGAEAVIEGCQAPAVDSPARFNGHWYALFALGLTLTGFAVRARVG